MFSKILVPIDIHNYDHHPVELAYGLARESGGCCCLFTVVDDSFPNPDILSFQLPWADYYTHLREVSERRLEEIREELGAGVHTDIVVVHGHPAKKIVEFVESENADLVVMATHATKGLHHALLGSVTDRVIRLVSCPVMVVRWQPEEGSAEPEQS